ncbi:membrane protein insertion efficiency factor YidD [Candidatus Marinamargulisbacteria bacterium SCGC AG-439-L15]|nr:membrane protein insertion efficiency factor YidD [Candidatus Marinamargulisbacteria bacterium SCGC AG-439-L15]
MKTILIMLIKTYQKGISPLFPSCCRFYPTCSQYTLEAVHDHGAIKGLWVGLRQLLSCHPFHTPSKRSNY